MTGPLINKTNPLVLRVDSETNIPYALAEASILAVNSAQIGTLSATTYSSLALSGLGDVSVTSTPSPGQALIWDGGLGKWIPGTGAGGGGGSPQGGTGAVQFESNTGTFDGEATFLYTKGSNTLSVENLNTVETIAFNTTVTPTFATGKVGWDKDNTTLQVQSNTNTSIPVGQKSVIYIVNNTANTITKGSVVVVNAVDPTTKKPSVVLACASATNSDSNYLVGVAAETMTAGSQGFMTTYGVVDNIQVAYAEGTLLFISNTSGQFTNVKPPKPAHSSFAIGRVLKQDAVGTNGTIFITIRGYHDINELHDVATTTPTNGQVLVYNSTTQLYEPNGVASIANISNYATTASLNNYATVASLTNYTPTASLANYALTSTSITSFPGTLTIAKGGTNNTSFTANRVIYYNATALSDNANLTFDGTTLTANTLNITNALGTAYGGTGQTSLGNVNVNSFAGTGVLATTASLANYETTGYARQTYETTSYARANYTTTATALTSFAGTLTVAKGGTGTTSFANTNVLYFTGTSVTGVSNLTFNGTTLTANTLNLTTALGTAYGGTGQTSLANVNVNSFAGTGVFATTASLASYATTASLASYATTASLSNYETTAYARQTYETTSYARNNYALTSTSITSFPGTLTIAKGGTNATSFNTNRVVYYNGTSLVDSANLTFDGTTLAANTFSASVYQNLPSGTATWNASALQGFTVATTTPTAGQFLIYAAGKWAPATYYPAVGSTNTGTISRIGTGGNLEDSNVAVSAVVVTSGATFNGTVYAPSVSATTVSAINVTGTTGKFSGSVSSVSLSGTTIYAGTGGYYAGGSSGITQQIQFLDGDGIVTHKLTFTNGILTGYQTL